MEGAVKITTNIWVFYLFLLLFFFGNHSEISVFIFSAKRNETKRIESKLRSPFARVYLIHTHTHSRTEPFDYHFSIKLFRFIDSRARRKRRNHFIRRCEELTVRFCAILNFKSMCWCVLEIFSFCVYKTNGTERNGTKRINKAARHTLTGASLCVYVCESGKQQF